MQRYTFCSLFIGVLARSTVCDKEKVMEAKRGLVSLALPEICDGKVADNKDCGQRNSYVIVPERSSFIDSQIMKLQETPETVPTGEMPRHILLAVERCVRC